MLFCMMWNVEFWWSTTKAFILVGLLLCVWNVDFWWSNTFAVCCEEESCRNMGMQGLWESESRRSLHSEVFFLIPFLSKFFISSLKGSPHDIVFSFLTALLVPLLFGAPSGGWGNKLKVKRLAFAWCSSLFN